MITALALVLSAPPLCAAPQGDTKTDGGKAVKRSTETRISLGQAVSTALARNLRLADSRLAIAEKEHQRREAYSDFFPNIDLQYVGKGYRYRNQEIVGQLSGLSGSRRSAQLSGVQSEVIGVDILGNPVTGASANYSEYPYRIDPYKSFTLSATITQPLFTGGRLINEYKYARLGVDYSEIQLEVDKQDLILDVLEAYEQLVQSEKLLEVADQAIRALQAVLNQTREFYRAGVVPKVDVLSTEGQLAQARIQRTQAVTDIERYKATLNWLLRFPQETPIDVVQDLSFRPNPYQIPDIYAIAAANRLEIRQANISVQQALALIKSAKADLLPTVNVQGAGSRVNDDWNVMDREANNDWRIQGILTWSFDMFRKRETVKERRAGEARSFVAREQLVEQIMQEVKTAYEDMRRSESDIQDNRKAVEFRRESFRINQERYKEQVATYIEVLDAQRQLSLAEGNYIIALIGFKINKAVLERRMGILREDMIMQMENGHAPKGNRPAAAR
jgi:outer membrane protein TolC